MQKIVLMLLAVCHVALVYSSNTVEGVSVVNPSASPGMAPVIITPSGTRLPSSPALGAGPDSRTPAGSFNMPNTHSQSDSDSNENEVKIPPR